MVLRDQLSTLSKHAGKNMIDWLMSWSFAKDRSSAAVVATDMLRNGFFHTVNLDASTSALMLSKDELLSRHVVDNEDSNYVFVSGFSYHYNYSNAVPSECETLRQNE